MSTWKKSWGKLCVATFADYFVNTLISELICEAIFNKHIMPGIRNKTVYGTYSNIEHYS